MHDHSRYIDFFIYLFLGVVSFPMPLSDEAIEDVVDALEPNELRHLYKELNLTPADQEDAVKENLDPQDVDLKEKARYVLKYWRQTNGSKATKKKILEALRANKRTQNAAYKLEQKWNVQYAPQADSNVNLNGSVTHSQNGPNMKKQKCSAKSDL